MAHFVKKIRPVVDDAMTCFTFDPISGLTLGIKLLIAVHSPRNDGTYMQPHIKCGESYISIERTSHPKTMSQGGDVLVTKARHRIIDLDDGRKVHLLAEPQGNSASQLVLIHSRPNNPRIKRKFDTESIRAWEGAQGGGTVERIYAGQGGDILLKFVQDDFIDLYFRDASAFRISRRNNTLHSERIPAAENAKVRVERMRGDLKRLSSSDDDVRRKHGILGSAIRLLSLTDKEYGARELIVEFLCDNIVTLTDPMRKQVNNLLAAWGDPAAANFVVVKESNVIDFRERLASTFNVKKGTPAEERARKQKRSLRDREERAVAKGASAGSGKKQGRAGK